ncbi:MAG: GNAT family N-acetyltransferase [Gemmatimonadetes bacterium]|jgi:predicted N-acetyltransferase YhbS|nr:GNAT family N-acetyltransferase [Gemmatimonadota bacterium]MBT6149762.1 GNAT family N-acetyltransferase [Gemmatimonadota bacterium]MBT7860248.1 GNAT family N-acetyltransferase [Gemmatimonadota bacterium]
MLVRQVTLRDVPAICDVHRDSDGPWVDPVECAIYVNHRLLRPFHCRIAERDGQVVGHAEWIVNHEPDRDTPCLYLGMLQVRVDSQGTGVGRRLIDDGRALAQRQACTTLRTVPDGGAIGFYEKCGFSYTPVAHSFRLPVQHHPISGWDRARSVPARASLELPMRLGWVQACSSHMWEICNHHAVLADEAWHHPCLTSRTSPAYVQLRYRDTSTAMPVAWAAPETPLEALIAAAQALASAQQIRELLLAIGPGEAASIPGVVSAEDIPIMESDV